MNSNDSYSVNETNLNNSQIQVERCTKQTASIAFPPVPAVHADTLLRGERAGIKERNTLHDTVPRAVLYSTCTRDDSSRGNPDACKVRSPRWRFSGGRWVECLITNPW